MWLEAGKSVKEIWIKSIFYRGQKLPIHSWMQKPLGRTDVWQYYPDGQHGKYARLRYRKNGIIIFQRYDKRIQSIQLCYYFESNGVRYKNICKATPVFEF